MRVCFGAAVEWEGNKKAEGEGEIQKEGEGEIQKEGEGEIQEGECSGMGKGMHGIGKGMRGKGMRAAGFGCKKQPKEIEHRYRKHKPQAVTPSPSSK